MAYNPNNSPFLNGPSNGNTSPMSQRNNNGGRGAGMAAALSAGGVAAFGAGYGGAALYDHVHTDSEEDQHTETDIDEVTPIPEQDDNHYDGSDADQYDGTDIDDESTYGLSDPEYLDQREVIEPFDLVQELSDRAEAIINANAGGAHAPVAPSNAYASSEPQAHGGVHIVNGQVINPYGNGGYGPNAPLLAEEMIDPTDIDYPTLMEFTGMDTITDSYGNEQTVAYFHVPDDDTELMLVDSDGDGTFDYMTDHSGESVFPIREEGVVFTIDDVEAQLADDNTYLAADTEPASFGPEIDDSYMGDIITV